MALLMDHSKTLAALGTEGVDYDYATHPRVQQKEVEPEEEDIDI